MAGANSRDRQLRERAEAVIPGGMYGHQAVGLLPDDYPQFFEKGDIDETLRAAEGAFAALKAQAPALAPVDKLAFLSAGAR